MADPKEFKDDSKYWWLKENVQDATSDLQRLHVTGQKIEGLIGQKSYGAGSMEKLGKALSKSVSQLSAFRKFSQTWTRDEIERWIGAAERKNVRLSWHHFRSLMAITPREFESERKAKAKRKELISRCIDEGWNTRQMHAAVQEELGPREDGRTRPRPLAKPENLEEGLDEFIDQTEAYLRRFDEVWFGSGGVISAEMCPKKSSRRVAKLQTESNEIGRRLRLCLDLAAGIRDDLN